MAWPYHDFRLVWRPRRKAVGRYRQLARCWWPPVGLRWLTGRHAQVCFVFVGNLAIRFPRIGKSRWTTDGFWRRLWYAWWVRVPWEARTIR